jgi:TonB-dependent SusC/RagA subfamily outer membrane receptor
MENQVKLTGTLNKLKLRCWSKTLQIYFTQQVRRVRVINSSGQPGADATVKIVVVLLMQFRSIICCRWCSFYWELKFDKLLRYRINNGIKDALRPIYGSRGANGVILITTKTGKAGAHIQVETKLR